MLRITTHHHAPATSFLLEGKLVGPWVKELEKCWEKALAADPSRAVLVNLAGVTFIDCAGRELLARMRRQGARLLSTGVLINAIVAEIEAEEEQKQRNAAISSEVEKEPPPLAKTSARGQ